MIYLDNAATTPVPAAVADAMYDVLTHHFGNPSSQYPAGQEMKKAVEGWRAVIAGALHCPPERLYFTSCGTESDNWAIQAAIWQGRHTGKHIITTAVEHSAVLEPCRWLTQQGYEVTYLKPDRTGHVAVEQVAGALRDDTVLVSMMLVNNETGCIFPVAETAQLLRDRKSHALLHCDAVQGFLKLPFTVKSLGADMVTISGHKIHAPKGIGALYIRSGLHLRPLIVGGSQEDGRRAGTEAMPNICAFGEAARIGRELMAESTERMAALRGRTVERLRAENPGLLVIGGGAPHILCISLPGYRSEVLMNYLEARGISVSKSSACKKGGRSHVLEAMGLPAPVIDGALRLGLSRFNTAEELDEFCRCLREARETLSHA